MRAKTATPLAVAIAFGLAYVLWAGWYVDHHPVSSLAHVSSFFQGRPGGSAAIARLEPRAADVGYDGQFYMYIAVDPTGARPYLDNPAYRYSRPVYPLAARALAGGEERLVPWTLLLLGVAGVFAATFAVATVLTRWGVSPWYGAFVGAYPGLFLGVSYDLAEPLAYGVLALGLLVWYTRRPRVLGAALLFGLAGVTRETTLLFPATLALWLAIRERRFRQAGTLLGIALAPYVAVKVALAVWLGSWGEAQAAKLEALPLLGLVRQWPWSDYQVQQILAVVVPALLAPIVVWLATRAVTPELCLLIVNVVVLVLLLPKPSYVNYLASGRIATGVIIAFLLCLPALLQKGRVAQAWLPIALWLLPWYTVLPEAVRR
ncbi:MAG: hypothetical protein ACJ757_17935 [Gaiellaceae bacterium]